MIFSFYNSYTSLMPVVLQGIVTNEEKQPLDKVHLYTILGEEESFSNAKGEFGFRTNQTFPLKRVVQYKSYKDKIITLTASETNLSIILK